MLTTAATACWRRRVLFRLLRLLRLRVMFGTGLFAAGCARGGVAGIATCLATVIRHFGNRKDSLRLARLIRRQRQLLRTAAAGTIQNGTRLTLKFAIKVFRFLVIQVDVILAFFLHARVQILLTLDDVCSLADVMPDGHLLRARAAVLNRFASLLDASRTRACARGSLIDLRPIRAGCHGNDTAAAERCTIDGAHVKQTIHWWRCEHGWHQRIVAHSERGTSGYTLHSTTEHSERVGE